ncbi:MAG: ATP-dependent helicase HrpB [Gemmatimonadota bacterium]
MHLPIDDVLGEIAAALAARTSLVLQAPPGAGKTTRVPLALVDAPWLAGRKIVMLEPRRLAARAAATFMARQLGEEVGRTVGYRIRFDTRVSNTTRIEVVTEGVLTRMLHSDAALEDYGLVIFDEFHERSLHADLGLALTLQSRALLRADLRIMVMSATLAGEAVAALIDGPLITSAGRSFPVETIFMPRPKDTRIEVAVSRMVKHALEHDDGDVLVFLPGAAEIHRTQELLAPLTDARTYVAPLFGNLTQPEQDRAIAPSRAGTRKVVLATSIAETSLTIEGVRVVVDSGLMRVPRFDARIGMTRLETVTVTRASADQRRGRAGRVASGVAYCLWSEYEDAALVPHGQPEILEADLAPLALDLAAWGITDPGELKWLDAPPASAFSQARELLLELGAIGGPGGPRGPRGPGEFSITDHGRRMAELPVHPRLAHMLLRAQQLGHAALACELAALLGERRLRSDHIDRAALAAVQREAAHFKRLLQLRDQATDLSAAGLLLALAYPDRIGMQRGARGKFVLRNGRGAVLDQTHPAAGEEFIVAAELEGSGRDSRVFLAAALSEAEIREHFADQIERIANVEITPAGSVQAVVREQLGALVLKESTAGNVAPEDVARALLRDILARGIESLAWSRSAIQLRERVAFMHHHDARWPDFSLDALANRAHEWLLPHLSGMRSRSAVAKLDLAAVLASALSWQQRAQLDHLAPTHLTVPTGSNIFIDYSNPDAPFAAVRLQEVFGLRETPRLAAGLVPLTLQLLSPAQRPVQVTRDLASFWQTGYFEVRKELKGRYPKHYWPDDPLMAEPTRGARRTER